ncbi:Protein trichome birefringence-like [Actinidia chinensis var. chinensis]|uniref:Protein trichome birefringence-like n=1 Tax=Actinidia chinensis var. chinensis TaxID=1590841 RepID=A0A2R6RRP9_ACTCC|nr:Protein trichome birefringence-like [Actinidia chinensis var. chinensis]
MGTAKTPRGRLPLSIVAIVIFIFFMIALLYTERFSSSIFKFKSCSRRASVAKSTKSTRDDGTTEDDLVNTEVDDRFEFDPNECSVAHGKWVFNSSFKPLYSDRTCPYLDRQFSCVKNGRPDSDYLRWEWQPDDCILPRFSPTIALEKLRGKRLMFVGDSLQRNQWESFVCLVEFVIPDDGKSMRRGRSHSVFTVKEYNATIEFYWAPFLVESNSDNPIIGDPKKRILKVDSVSKHAKYWVGVDILAFNTYVWWMSGTKVKSLWGSFANGEEGSEDLDTAVAYKIGLKTWANWIDSTLDPNKTRVFFTTMSPTHARSEDWNHEDGKKCFNETKPVSKRGHWGTGSNKQMMSVVAGVVEKMRVPVTFINITQLSEYRKDGHSSIYNELGGKLLTDEQRADPKHYADCIHWCLPGVPDTWNQIFWAHL